MNMSSFARFRSLKVILPVLGLAWLGIFIFGLLPALEESRERGERIGEIEGRIETLGGWQESRVAFVGDVEPWQETLDDHYALLFPEERQLKELFYQIAEAADASGINPITVRSISEKQKVMTAQQAQMEGGDVAMGGMDDMSMDGGNDMGSGPDALYSGLDLSPRDFPDSDLESHFLAIDLDATFNDLTRFLDRLDRLERAVTVNSIELSPGVTGTNAQIDLEYYVQASN